MAAARSWRRSEEEDDDDLWVDDKGAAPVFLEGNKDQAEPFLDAVVPRKGVAQPAALQRGGRCCRSCTGGEGWRSSQRR
uniref:Uncharacterized protein n=1 Tax=Leersia perrieri TaxID=77586 RepID=A0A0D9WWW6_9ORYZ